jgi:hypothetical protein
LTDHFLLNQAASQFQKMKQKLNEDVPSDTEDTPAPEVFTPVPEVSDQ